MNPTPAQLAAAAKAVAYVRHAGRYDPERVARDVLAALLPVGYAMVHLTRRNIWMEGKGERQHEPVGGYVRCALIPVEPK